MSTFVMHCSCPTSHGNVNAIEGIRSLNLASVFVAALDPDGGWFFAGECGKGAPCWAMAEPMEKGAILATPSGGRC